MAVYSLSPIYRPQFVGLVPAALVFATPGSPTEVPANYQYQISVLRVANVTSAPVSLTVWRVPQGGGIGNENAVVPSTVLIPAATQTFPDFDVTALWGAVLTVGESIWAQAGAADALSIQGDGVVIQP